MCVLLAAVSGVHRVQLECFLLNLLQLFLFQVEFKHSPIINLISALRFIPVLCYTNDCLQLNNIYRI